MAIRKIFPALRIFSEGTWVLIRWEEEREEESLGKGNRPNEFLDHVLIRVRREKHNSLIHIYIAHSCDMSLFYVED